MCGQPAIACQGLVVGVGAVATSVATLTIVGDDTADEDGAVTVAVGTTGASVGDGDGATDCTRSDDAAYDD